MRALLEFRAPDGAAAEDLLRRIEQAGVAIDRRFGARCVNPSEGRYVARGEVDDVAREKLTQLGVVVLGDSKIRPV
jgi:hypothetical protein